MQKMKTTGKLKTTGLSRETILDVYKAVMRGRRVDERLWQLTRIGKFSFNISGQGAEVGQAAMALAFDYDKDYFLPYYRDLTAVLMWGMTTKDIMLAGFGKEADPASHGRQMPSHYGSKAHNIVSHSSPVSTQYPISAGIAYGAQMRGEDYVTVVTTGDGSFSQGECAEAMNIAGVHKMPVVFVVENNGYAISVPDKEQYAVEKLADRGPAFGFKGIRVNGSDFAETYLAFKQAVTDARQGNGPTLIEIMVERLTSHSSDDDQQVYRSAEELAEIKENDPVKLFQQQLIDEGYLNEADIDRIEKELETEINQATDEAEAMPDPDPAKITDQLYAE